MKSMSSKQKRKRRQAQKAKAGESAPAAEPAASGSYSSTLPIIIAVVFFVGLFAGLALRYGANRTEAEASQPVPPPGSELSEAELWERRPVKEINISPERDFVLGPEDAPITVVEFSDFECPYCRDSSYLMKHILDNYPDDVRLVFKNFPLDTSCNDGIMQQIHSLACRAATLARCAGEANPADFWKVHDALFEPPKLSTAFLDALPGELGLDTSAIDRCVESGAGLAAVKEDVAEGRRQRVRSTPTIYVNGRMVVQYDVQNFRDVLDHILAKPDAP